MSVRHRKKHFIMLLFFRRAHTIFSDFRVLKDLEDPLDLLVPEAWL